MSTDSAPRTRHPQRTVRWAILLGAIGIVLYLCIAILRPFVDVIAWSTVIAITFYPMYKGLVRATHRPSLSALISSVVVIVAFLIPLLLITALAVNQFFALRDYLAQRFSGGFELQPAEPLRQAWEWVLRRLGMDPSQVVQTITEHASELGGIVAGYSLAFATNITGAIVSFVFTIFAMFFLFRDGERIVRGIPDYLPFERGQSESVLLRIRDVIYASVYGIVVIAGLQGVLLGLSFSVLGIPSPVLWGVVTLFTSVIPVVGASAVWVPGAVYLLLTDRWVQALLLIIWGTAVVSAVDNFLRPKVVAGRVGLSELVMFFAVLGGLRAFGILGVVIGPVVFAIAASLLAVVSEGDNPLRTSVVPPPDAHGAEPARAHGEGA